MKPVLPVFVKKVEKCLNISELDFDNFSQKVENHKLNEFEHLISRIEKEKVQTMMEQSVSEQKPAVNRVLDEPLAEECSIDDFMKVDLRVAKILKAEQVEGADKLLRLELEIGDVKKQVFAGIKSAYQPDSLIGRLVVCVANLKPRKMKFGMSEGMVCAAGAGGKEIFLLSPDSGAKSGDRIH